MEESQQEATEKEVERILGYLKSYYQDDREFEVDLRDIARLCKLLVAHVYFFSPLLLSQQPHQYHITSSSLTPAPFPGQWRTSFTLLF